MGRRSEDNTPNSDNPVKISMVAMRFLHMI